MNLRHAFGKAVADLNMFPNAGERVLVACSGGADSLALLYLLYAWRERFAINLGVVTVDHQLREESVMEVQLVRQTAWTLGLPCWVKRVDAGVARPPGISLEMYCRELRRRELLATAKAVGAGTIALGHHANDQAETMLLRLARGTGPRGLAGMRAISMEDGIRLIRPLLRIESADLRSFLREHGLLWLDDPSNRDTAFTRNRIRQRVLPALTQSVNPVAVRHMQHTAELLREDDDYLSAQAAKALRAMTGGTARKLDLKRWRRLAPPIARRVLLGLVGVEKAEYVARWFQDLYREGVSGRRWNTDGEQWCEEDGWLVHIDQHCPLSQEPTPLHCPGEIALPEIDSKLSLCTVDGVDKLRASASDWRTESVAYLPASCLRTGLALGFARKGARFQPMGAPGSRKVRDVFMDLKIPVRLRDDWPIVYCGDELVWVPGSRIAEGWGVSKGADAVMLCLRHNGVPASSI